MVCGGALEDQQVLFNHEENNVSSKEVSGMNNGEKTLPFNSIAKDRIHAMTFLFWSDRGRYGTLLDGLDNNHNAGTNQYPETLTAAYHILLNYNGCSKTTSNKSKTDVKDAFDESRDDRDTGLSFLQDDDNLHM